MRCCDKRWRIASARKHNARRCTIDAVNRVVGRGGCLKIDRYYVAVIKARSDNRSTSSQAMADPNHSPVRLFSKPTGEGKSRMAQAFRSRVALRPEASTVIQIVNGRRLKAKNSNNESALPSRNQPLPAPNPGSKTPPAGVMVCCCRVLSPTGAAAWTPGLLAAASRPQAMHRS
jgi:hypothetical protein